MVDRAHRVEEMRGVPDSALDTVPGAAGIGCGMSECRYDPAALELWEQLPNAAHLGRQGDHPDQALASVENVPPLARIVVSDRFSGLGAERLRADPGAFQMNPDPTKAGHGIRA